MELVHTHGRMSSEQIYREVVRWPLDETDGQHKERPGVQRLLRRLTWAGYLNHSEDQDRVHEKRMLPTTHRIFESSKKGVMALNGTSPQRAWRFDAKDKADEETIAHRVMQTQGVLCCLHGAEDLGLDCAWYDPDAFARDYGVTSVGDHLPIRPDGFFRFRPAERNPLHFFLEVHRSTEPTETTSHRRASVERKVKAFTAFYRTKANLNQARPPIPGYDVLFVIAERQRTDQRTGAGHLRAMLACAAKHGPQSDMFRFTTYDQLDLANPMSFLTDPIWYDIEHGLDDPQPLLREIPSPATSVESRHDL